MEMTKNYEILVPNLAFAWGTSYHMTTDEFLLYTHLQFMRQGSQWNLTLTSVDMIIHYLKLGTKNKHRDKEKVVGILNELTKKDYITIDCAGNIKKDFFAVNQNQEVLSPDFEIENGDKRKFKGYTKITGQSYNLARNDGRALMTITYINWRNNIDYKVPKSEWCKVLGVTKSTLEDSFKVYQSRFLKVIQGEYYLNNEGQVRQRTNSHVIEDKNIKSVNLIEQHQIQRQTVTLENYRNQVTDNYVKDNEDVFMQIFDKKTYMEFKGYKAWRETNCKIVKMNGQTKIDAIKNSKKKGAGFVISKLETDYQEYLQHKKKQLELMQRHHESESTEHPAEECWQEEYSTSYKKKERVDILQFLDD